MYVVFCKIDHCIHIHWCTVMGLGHNDPWVESHMWPQETWGQRSSRGQWPLVQVFGKKGQCIHILWCIFKPNITMIAKVCDRESRRDTWFENRLVLYSEHITCFLLLLVWSGQYIIQAQRSLSKHALTTVKLRWLKDVGLYTNVSFAIIIMELLHCQWQPVIYQKDWWNILIRPTCNYKVSHGFLLSTYWECLINFL